MKRTQLFLGTFGVSALALAAVLTKSTMNTNPDYVTLSQFKKAEEREEKKEKIAGALEWQRMIKANQVTGLVDPMDVSKALDDANRLMHRNAKSRAQLSSTAWEETGPNNIGGRARALIIDKNNSNKLLIGTSGGGVFISNDGGDNWTKRVGNDSSSAIAVCAMTQAANGDIYYGTGEGFGAGIAYIYGAQTQLGEGIFKSTDGGSSFNQLQSTKPSNSNSSSDSWVFVNKLVAHPSDANKIYAATGAGLRITSDGGATWAKPASLNTSSFMADVEISTDGNRVIAASNNNIYISNDGGATFGTSIMGLNGMPSASGVGRIDIAIAPSDANYVYAVLAANNTLKGIYKSTDGGVSWTTIGVGGSAIFDPLGEQAFWNIAFGVHPTNPEMVFLGGQLDLYRYTPGSLWVAIANWLGNPFLGRLVHADMHGIMFNPSNPNTMYVVNDGGFYRTTNCADPNPFFTERNKNLSATQCYGVAANTLGQVVYGAQDNGSGLMGKNANTPLEANNLTGGDGMRCAISSLNPNVVITSTFGGNLRRATDGGVNALSFKSFFDANIDVDDDGDPEEPSGAIWNAPIFLKEKKGADNTNLSAFLFGTNASVWLTQGATSSKAIWFKIGSISGVSALCVPKNNNKIVYVGNATGAVYRIDLPNVLDSIYRYNDTVASSGAFNFQPEIKQTLIGNFAGRYVTDIDASADGNVAFVSLGNYGNSSYIYKSIYADTASSVANAAFADFGGTGASALPKMPIYSVLCLNGNPNQVLIGTELGVWGSEGTTPFWLEVNRPGPDDTKWHPRAATYEIIEVSSWWKKDGSVFAGPVVYTGTHGRGTFRSTTHATLWPVGIEKVNENSEKISIYPNPATSQTTINYNTTASGKAQVRVYSLTGSLVKTQEINVIAGENAISLNVGDLATGGYVVYLVNGNRNAVTKFIKH